MTITQMEYALAVEKFQNFRKAAGACHVSQPSLSSQIQKLEEQLGAVLFDRSRSPVKPTTIGQVLLQQMRVVVTEAYRLPELVNQEKQEVKGDLKLGIIPTIAPYLLPLFVKKMHQQYPALQLKVSELTTENCLAALDKEEIDVAVLATKEDKEKYFQETLFTEPMLLYVSDDHPYAKKKSIKVEDISVKDLWLLEEGHCLRTDIISICNLRKQLKNLPRNLEFHVGNLEAIRNLVEENSGYTLLPYISTLRLSDIQHARLKNVVDPVPSRTLNLTVRRRFLKSAAIQALKQEIMTTVPAELLKD